MGLFDKIKNILFEDDDEVESMPVYTKEDTLKEPITKENDDISFPEEPIKTSDSSHFNNVKRDIDFSFGDDEDVINDVTSLSDTNKKEQPQEETKSETVVTVQKEQKASIFPSFDEAEFDRLNSRINKHENKIKRETKENNDSISAIRKANNNFSSTTTTDKNRENDKYKINISSTPGRKPFTPSPVISPVYGILDKNYRKDEIVDKKGGMKREKIVKSVADYGEKKDIIDSAKKETTTPVTNIDEVRKKAYGELENLEKQAALNESHPEEVKVEELTAKEIVVENEPTPQITANLDYENEPSIEDQLDDKNYEITNVIDVKEEPEIIDKKLSDATHLKEKNNTPHAMDEMEKTSTLQILDDIEKELNSIKPLSEEESLKEDNELKERIAKGDTLETDLFNLIDSMYEEGEEDEDD